MLQATSFSAICVVALTKYRAKNFYSGVNAGYLAFAWFLIHLKYLHHCRDRGHVWNLLLHPYTDWVESSDEAVSSNLVFSKRGVCWEGRLRELFSPSAFTVNTLE